MTTPPLSPAAQAAVNAHHNALCSDNPNYEAAIAAALRAVADQVAPIQLPIGGGFRQHRSAIAERLAIRRELLSIANELDP